MSTFYKIGEIAALYGVSTDVLRYYEELGILVPRRGSNGYRIYRTEDLWCLNIIRDLRELGFLWIRYGIISKREAYVPPCPSLNRSLQ